MWAPVYGPIRGYHLQVKFWVTTVRFIIFSSSMIQTFVAVMTVTSFP